MTFLLIGLEGYMHLFNLPCSNSFIDYSSVSSIQSRRIEGNPSDKSQSESKSVYAKNPLASVAGKLVARAPATSTPLQGQVVKFCARLMDDSSRLVRAHG